MSIYDNLADSDFLDPGKFREQLKQMSQMEGTEKSEQANHLQANAGSQAHSNGVRAGEQNLGLDMDTQKRQNHVMQELNPMDGENEMSLPPIRNNRNDAVVDADIQKQLDFLKQKIAGESDIKLPEVQKFEFSKQISEDRHKFEDQIKNRVSLPDDDLFEEQNPYSNMAPPSREKVDNLRQQMIFDDQLELSARNQDQQVNTINTDRNEPKAKSEFTLKTYESKPELQGQMHLKSEEHQMETAHFNKQRDHTNTNPSQKTQNTDKDNMMIDQRAFNFGKASSSNSQYQDSNQRQRIENEGTGQFGTKENRELSSSNAKVDQFDAIDIKNLQQSPKIKNKASGENDQISQLLAQLQAPSAGAHQSQTDLEKAHQQMQESIKQMKLVADPGALHNNEFSAIEQGSNANNGIGFNGQNSLYELAQRVGQPLSSSNLYSMSQFDNEDDFQQFLKGEGSMGSALTNQQSNHPYMNHNQAAQNHDAPHRNHAQDQAQQLLIQMQDSSQSNVQNVRPMLVNQRKPSNQNLQQPTSQQSNRNMIYPNDKENFNERNMESQPQRFEEQSYQNQQQMIMLNPQQQQPVPPPQFKRQMSLAERAQQAKLANQAAEMARQEPPIRNMNDYNNDYNSFQRQNNQMVPNDMQQQRQFNQNYRQSFNPNFGEQVNNNYNTGSHSHQRPSLIQQEQQYSQRPSLLQNQQQQPYKGQNQDFSKTNKNEAIQKRQALMANFDDIPIHQLHKADGYQLRNIDDEDTPTKEFQDGRGDAFDATNEDDLKNLSLKDQVFHTKWKVRMNAFKLINKELIEWKDEDREIAKEDEMYGDPENPFDVYGPILEQMIKDTNLTAQYEGLNCLYSYVSHGRDIKSVTFACHSYLLDKIQHNKPNLNDITQRILQKMLLKKQNIMPEVLKRLKSKNRGALTFCLSVLNKAIDEGNISIQDTNLKLFFKSTQELVSHSVKEIRESAIQLIVFVYKNCEDDLTTFCDQFQSLRPVQLKELKEQLSTHNKNQNAGYLVKLFDKVHNSDSRKDLNQGVAERSPVGRSKSVESNRQAKSDQDEDEQQQIDISNLTPENFSEIPYINQINVKRKSMEQFNQELEKLVAKQQAQASAFEGESTSIVKVKDYVSIFNIVIHMLEDPNMLVFIEGIKTVEYLAVLLRSAIKSAKMKQFIQLLANKYKETKTAVLVALEKTFFAIYDNRCIQTNSFFDQLINQVAFTHKNPRVKQLVIDRVDVIITKSFLEENGGQQSAQQLLSIFKLLKEKLKQIIVKDTNASVRDAGINLLAKFMIIIGQSEESLQPVQEIVNSLPKYRIQEITKKIEESQYGEQISAKNANERQQSAREKQSRGNSAAAGGGPRSQRQKSSEKVGGQPPQQEYVDQIADMSEQRFLFNTKKAQIQVSNEFQMSISEIILTIKNIGSDKDRLRPQQIVDNLQQGLEDLADDGVKECKGLIVQCIYWLLTNYPHKMDFLEPERQEGLYALINLMKKMYCIEREITDPQELNQAIGSALIFFALFDEHVVVVQLLNVLYVAATSKGTSLNFLNAVKQHLTKHDPSPRQVPNGKAVIISSTIFFIADKLSEMMLKSQMNDNINDALQLNHFEELRSMVIQQIEQTQEESQKQMLIECIVCLRDMTRAYQEEQAMKVNGGPKRDYGNIVMDQGESLQASQISLPETKGYDDQKQQEEELPKDEQVLLLIERDFEKGLLQLRELVKDEQMGKVQLIFDQKERIILRLLALTTQQYTNPQEQYRQAYSLKALMWLKEEFIGLEECFKLAHQIMDGYVKAMVDGRDSSIEQYLLNFWTKDLSLRDLVDRTSVTAKQGQSHHLQSERFHILFNWLMNQKLLQDQIAWTMEDFRKVAILIAQIALNRNLQENLPLQFIDHAVNKFGAKKVRDFMEIQLIQDNELLMRFLDQFDQKYMATQASESSNQNIRINSTNNQPTTIDSELSHALFNKDMTESKGGSILQEPLLTNRSNYNSTKGQDRSQMLQEMRDKRKGGKMVEDENLEDSMLEEKRKYEEIMARLEKHKSQRNIDTADADRPVAIEGLSDQKRIQTQSNLAKNADNQSERPISNYNKRYSTQEGMQQLQSRQDSVGFNDEEDFKLSAENQQSVNNFAPSSHPSRMMNNQERSGENFMQDRVNQQSHNRIGSALDCSKNFGEGLREQVNDSKQLDTLNDDSRQSALQESRQKIRASVQYQEERLQRLESSQIKVRQMKNEMDILEDERRKIQMERQMLLAEQNQQSEQWKARYQEMTAKNDEIVANLAVANQSYLNQVSENENLTNQIGELQAQHREILSKYRQMEEKLQYSEQLVEEQKIQLDESQGKQASFVAENSKVIEKQIENAFGSNQMMQYGDNMGGQIGVRKIQELLLDSEGASKTLASSMIQHYQKLKSKTDRMQMIQALKQSLENEDVLFAISAEIYKSLLNFLLSAFSFEKELIERESIQKTHEREQQNELTQESQRLVSKLLNSKEFTASLIVLLQLLKTEAMPDDITTNLSIQERQYMRVIMRCISRITKALHSENPDLVRAFDVLIEMQKLFVKHPPENLRQDLPCLSEFDYIYRGLKEVSDILIELQPEKCISFLKFYSQAQEEQQQKDGSAAPGQPNAFIKYIQQMMHVHPAYQNNTEHTDF